MSAWVRDIHSMDLIILRDVLWSDEYRLQCMDLPKDATVVDLGGNIGTFCVAAHHYFPTAQLVAYEPSLSNVEMFKMNAPYATIIQKAAAAKTGTVRFEQGKNFVGLRVLKEGGEEIQSVSLDDIVKDFDRVDLLKVDIEGSEYDLFNNASPETFQKIQRIVMETHAVEGFDEHTWTEDILGKHGFMVEWLSKTPPTSLIYAEKSYHSSYARSDKTGDTR